MESGYEISEMGVTSLPDYLIQRLLRSLQQLHCLLHSRLKQIMKDAGFKRMLEHIL
jgi:hypothetical protein